VASWPEDLVKNRSADSFNHEEGRLFGFLRFGRVLRGVMVGASGQNFAEQLLGQREEVTKKECTMIILYTHCN
jgi:hypothetical protein